jgi:hypothetical protein
VVAGSVDQLGWTARQTAIDIAGDITAVPTLFLFDKTGKKDGESRLRSPA